jgi:hypothetical protein
MRAPMVPAPRTATLWMRFMEYLGGATEQRLYSGAS